MKWIIPTIAAAALSTFALSPAIAACPDKTGSVTTNVQTGIAKDGTHAPLEDGANSQTQIGAASVGTTTSSSDAKAEPEKDGKTMPMAADKNLATSDQDVAAQQKGDQTAAAMADDKKDCVD